VSFGRNSAGALEITDNNNYYPFGMNHIGGMKSMLGAYQNYKYNGKELQETGIYDYGARFYMPDIRRWGVADPLAETSRRWSTYAYAYNNPIRFIDPDGMQNYDITFGKNISVETQNKIVSDLEKETGLKLSVESNEN
jgi:RHS repeat-associated protein